MNILFIINHLNTGGITSYTLTLGGGLKKKGHNVYIASSGGELLSKFQEAGLIYIPVPLKTKREVNVKIIFSALKLSRVIKEKRIDIVHSHSRTTQVLACLLARFTGAKHIFTCHGFFKRRLLRRIFPCWGKKNIAISSQVKEHLVNDFRVPDKDVDVINNGIDVDKFKRGARLPSLEIRKNLGLGSGPVIGIIARLSDVKGHQYLLEAMKTVLEKHPLSQLLIVGEGKIHGWLNELAGSLGIERSVFFVPKASDMVDVLSIIDIFVMPSLKEGLGLALMEAMASARPVIGSNVGGIKSLIQDNRNGLLVEPADSQALATALLELIDDPLRCKELGARAQVFIADNFPQEKMVSETEKEYLKCLNA